MATVTYNCTKDASALQDNEGWSGWDDHHPVGQNPNGFRWASFVYFPVNFSGMTGITSATLKLTGAQVDFVTHNLGTSSTTLKIRRMTSDWGEGTNRGENLWSQHESWDYSNRVLAGYTTSGETSVTTGPQNSSWNNVVKSYDVTDIVKAWAPASAGGSGRANYGFQLRNDSNASADGIEYYSRHVSGKVPQLVVVYTTNTAPNAPTNLLPTGDSVAPSLNPTLTGSFSDPNSGDSLSAIQVIVYADDGTTIVEDSGTLAASGQTFSRTVATTLTGNTFYKWKVRTRDAGSLWGPYTALQRFKANSSPPVPSGLLPAHGGTIGTLTPVFSGLSDDADPGDQLAFAQVIVYSDAAGATVVWASTELAATGSTFSITYAGPGLSQGTTYYWKARVRDTNGAYSDYTSLKSFITPATGTPFNLSPANTKVNTLTPTLAATAASTMNAYQIIVYESDGTTVKHDTGTVGASGTAISHLYAGSALSFGSKYQWAVRARDSVTNIFSAYTANQPFWTNSSPTASQSSPSNGEVVGTLTPAFTSVFSDTDKSLGFNDAPTVYTVEVYRVSDSVLMHTLVKNTGLSSGFNSVSRTTEGTALSNDVLYQWRAKYTDNSGATNAAGGFSGYWTFKPTQAPTLSSFVAQAADLTAGVLNKPNPTFTWSFSGSNGKTQLGRQFAIFDSNGALIYTSHFQTTSSTSYVVPAGYLKNLQSYTFWVQANDTDGVYSVASTVVYTTSWTPPLAITGVSVTTDLGRTQVQWDPSTQTDVDFNRYSVYRRPIGTSAWSLVLDITTKSTTQYLSYTEPFGVNYEWMVTQWKNIPASEPVESDDSDVAVANDPTDDWWIVVPNRDDLSFRLLVSDEKHTTPFQEETFEPFGRDRKVVVRSGILGTEGSLNFIIPSDERVANDQKLDSILALITPVYVKSPFGDVFNVYLSEPTRSYKAGGHLEVDISYVEVE